MSLVFLRFALREKWTMALLEYQALEMATAVAQGRTVELAGLIQADRLWLN